MKKGFTLIEVMVGVFILSVAIVGAVSMFPMGIKVETAANRSSVAIQLGQESLEEIISKSYNEISVGTFEENYGVVSNFELYKRVIEITFYDPVSMGNSLVDSGIKKVEVNVYWESFFGSGEKNISLLSLVSRK